MKIAFAFNFVMAFFVFTSIQAQTKSQSPLSSNHKKNIQLPFEKVYLHLDRPFYSSGDDIWFKAYLVNALTNKLYDSSNNLYVELISPNTKIIKRFSIRLDKGLGTGDIHLGDSIPSGTYQIIAYTNWMRNFGEVFFFKKEIIIENQLGISALKQPIPQAQKEKVDVQFFPEGGSLIEDTYSLVGFKVINSLGYGCNVKGTVFSSLGDSVASFTSLHLGMGSFSFISKKGIKYFAVGSTENGASFKVELPTALKTGYSFRVADIDKDNIHISIKTNHETLGQEPLHELIIVGSVRNLLCVTAKIKVRAMVNSVTLPKKEFPAGIARITLMDTTGNIYCERLFYVPGKENYRISIVPDNKVYAPRQKVTLQISVKDTSSKPVFANLSVSVVDGSQVKGFEKKPDIRSYLLLESEIRGHIEQPFYYFDTTVRDRFKALDNLLLTQGWRSFVWKYLSDTAVKIDYPIEKGILVSGKLRRLLVNKPIVDANISMAIFGNGKPSFNISKTDSSGKYYFDGLNFTGSQRLIISATNKNNRSQGWISLDSIFGEPAPVKYSWVYKPENLAKETSDYKEEADRKYNILKKYHVTDTIALSAVVIKGRKPIKETDDGHFRMYGEPDFSLTVDDKMSGYSDVFQILQGRVAGLMISGVYPNISFSVRGSHSSPLFLLDGMAVDIDVIATVPVGDIDKVEVLKSGANLAMFGSRGGSGVISIFTKMGVVGSSKPVFHSINQSVYGYYQVRSFYSPKYNVRQPEHEKPDLRTTIHWEPNIVTDADGNATFSFFNADSKTNIKIDVEGIAESGLPLVGKASYEVK